MLTKYIDMTGRTEDEAVSKALAQLGLERDDVSVEVLERAKKGFFGIGASPAKVRVTYGLEDRQEVPASKPTPQPAPTPAGKKEQPVPKAKPQPEVSAPAKLEKIEKTETPERTPREKISSERPERRDRRRDRAKGEQKNVEKAAAPTEAQKPAPAPVDLGEPCDDAKSQQIVAFLSGLLEHMGNRAEVKVYKGEENRYKVILEGEKLGQLIGRRGETLDAIQQLTNYAVNKSGEKRVRIHVDAENYRLKREQSLQALALKMADKAVRTKRNCTLEPMNAYERHVIHTALQEVPNVTTYSMGTEPNRRVIVAYDKNKQQQ